ncbi:ArsR family transcriptional regulator [Methylocystis sp. SC2]|uniref:ArsR family transcriptional regulator n=1 Tax=Methylocystis sp. (strain SC2) TaxID=187303 RepID=UPI0002F139B6|nr:ArsR family transcriptional regulator [Methylocystis sp. SC2]
MTTRLSIANASQHLQHMRRAGLVGARRDGKFVYYRLADEAALDLLAALGRLAERKVAEVERIMRRYFNDRERLEPVPRDELFQRIRDGSDTVLDVRPEDEFALGHLPNALKIPLKAMEARLYELDPSREVVAYCRGVFACFPSRRRRCCAGAASTPAVWRTACPNGAPRDCRSSPRPDE